MKANELRIGNYLNGKQGHVVISEIRINNSVKIHDNTSSFYLGICLMPIEITKKWLLKLGFEYNEFEDLYQKAGFDIDIEDNVYCHFYFNEYGDWYKYIEYVHELQNLYFALTGEELTVEL